MARKHKTFSLIYNKNSSKFSLRKYVLTTLIYFLNTINMWQQLYPVLPNLVNIYSGDISGLVGWAAHPRELGLSLVIAKLHEH